MTGLLADAERAGDGEEAEEAEHPRGDVGPGDALARRLEPPVDGGVEEIDLGDHGLRVTARHVPGGQHLRANPPRRDAGGQWGKDPNAVKREGRVGAPVRCPGPTMEMPMTRPRRHLAPLLAAVTALAACGSGSPSGTPAPAPEQSRTAAQIYADALADLATERSVHVVGHEVDSTGTASDIDVLDAQNSASITLRAAGATIYLVVTPDNVYASQTQAGPWVTAPPDLATNSRSLTLVTTVRCGRIEHGHLTKGAISTVDGQRVIAIHDDGKAPGASPSTAYVAISGLPASDPRRVTTAPPPRAARRTAATPAPAARRRRARASTSSDWGAPVTVTPPPSGGV